MTDDMLIFLINFGRIIIFIRIYMYYYYNLYRNEIYIIFTREKSLYAIYISIYNKIYGYIYNNLCKLLTIYISH